MGSQREIDVPEREAFRAACDYVYDTNLLKRVKWKEGGVESKDKNTY